MEFDNFTLENMVLDSWFWKNVRTCFKVVVSNVDKNIYEKMVCANRRSYLTLIILRKGTILKPSLT